MVKLNFWSVKGYLKKQICKRKKKCTKKNCAKILPNVLKNRVFGEKKNPNRMWNLTSSLFFWEKCIAKNRDYPGNDLTNTNKGEYKNTKLIVKPSLSINDKSYYCQQMCLLNFPRHSNGFVVTLFNECFCKTMRIIPVWPLPGYVTGPKRCGKIQFFF